MSYADEINERLGYDADITDSRQYCKHGTFIGSWWGPDYLCYWCEMGGEPPAECQLAPYFDVKLVMSDGRVLTDKTERSYRNLSYLVSREMRQAMDNIGAHVEVTKRALYRGQKLTLWSKTF